MKFRIVLLASLLGGLVILPGCETYVVNDDFNHIIKSEDLPFHLKVLEDDDNNFVIKKFDDRIQIRVEDHFSASSGAIKIKPNNNYRIKVDLKNESSNPIIICSFWKSVLSQSRQFVISGENGNPPSARSQQQLNEWQLFEESFTTMPGEDFMVIRLLSNGGVFNIKNISIVKIKNE